MITFYIHDNNSLVDTMLYDVDVVYSILVER
jgi:hypothetical protein